MMHDAHIIEIAKSLAVIIYEYPWSFDEERKVSIEKKSYRMVKIYFFKALYNRFD